MKVGSKDFYTTWRSPMIWLVLALLSFIAAWLFWQMIDRYTQLQHGFQALPNPPSLTTNLWVPYLLILAKLVLLVVAMTAGFSFAQERAQKTIWYLLINKQKFIGVVCAKLSAQWPVLLWSWLLLACACIMLAVGGTINFSLILTGTLGLSLLIIWSMALGQLISSFCLSTGTAVLLNVLVFVMLWMLGADILDQEYGLNWLSLVSPAHHFNWFCTGEIGISSLIYFVGGSGLFIWLTSAQLRRLKKII